MLSRIELVKNDVGLPEIRKPVALESWLGFASGDKNRDRTVSSATIAPPNAVSSSSSSMAEGISNAGDDNKSPRESRTLTTAEELSRVEGALENLSSKTSGELTNDKLL
ncbi:MAG: hypothetical protein LBB24_01485, partial [Rickettsiales bacterium]|jgi:hypothetical protein|nr:hypothetical protein [Rickettsiales bacterium]